MGWIKKLLSGVLLGLFIVSCAYIIIFIFNFWSKLLNYYDNSTYLILHLLIQLTILVIFFISGILFAFLYKREWPYWLNGGIIGIIIGIITSIILFFNLFDYKFDVPFPDPETLFPMRFFVKIMPDCSGEECVGRALDLMTLIPPLSILYSFLIGAIIGWLYGKIKSRNQSQLNQNTNFQ